MDGLIPLFLKALKKKKKAMRHYRSLSSSGHLADVDVTEPSPLQGPFFMTPQHPRAPRWHGGDVNVFMTPQHHRAARRLDEGGDDDGEPAVAAAVPAAMVPATVVRAKSGSTRRRPIMGMEAPPPPLRY